MGVTYIVKLIADKELRLEDVDDVVNSGQRKTILFRRNLGDSFKTLAEVSVYNMLYYKEIP